MYDQSGNLGGMVVSRRRRKNAPDDGMWIRERIPVTISIPRPQV